MHVYIYVYFHLYVYIYIYIYIHTHTYTLSSKVGKGRMFTALTLLCPTRISWQHGVREPSSLLVSEALRVFVCLSDCLTV